MIKINNFYSGTSKDAPASLPSKSIFFEQDTSKFYTYDTSGKRVGVNNAVDSAEGVISTETKASNVGPGVGDDWMRNVFVGKSAGNQIDGLGSMKGNLNVAVGSAALSSLTTGIQNNCIGAEAGASITTGIGNNIMGDGGMYAGSTVSFNHGIGKNVLQNITTGSENISLGHNSGYYAGTGTTKLTNGSNHIMIGYSAGPSANSSVNEIVIGHQARGIGANSVVLGHTTIVKTVLRGVINAVGLPTFADDGAASSLNTGDLYKTATGEVRYKL